MHNFRWKYHTQAHEYLAKLIIFILAAIWNRV
jgi:hypothetical protein